MLQAINVPQPYITMNQPECTKAPEQETTNGLNATAILRARLAENRKLREHSPFSSPRAMSLSDGSSYLFGSADTINDLVSLRNEVQMMRTQIEKDAEVARTLEKKRAEDSETIKNLLQVVLTKLSDKGTRSVSEGESLPQDDNRYLEKADGGSLMSTELEQTSSSEVKDLQHGHDQGPKSSATESSANPKLGGFAHLRFESLQHRVEHHSRDAETVSSEAQDLEEVPFTRVELSECNQEQHPKQARKEYSTSSGSTIKSNARLETSQIDRHPKQATAKSTSSSALGKRSSTGDEHPWSDLEQPTKHTRTQYSTGLQACDEIDTDEGIQARETTKKILPMSTPQQACKPTPAHLQKTSLPVTRQRTANLARKSARQTRNSNKDAEMQPIDTGIRKRTRDRSDLWLVSEQGALIQVMNEERKRFKGTAAPCAEIARAFNEKMKGVVQQRGERFVTGAALQDKRIARGRTTASIRNMMKRCEKEGKCTSTVDGNSVEQPWEIEDDDDEVREEQDEEE
ncbi:hypothetical protein BKA64DRAFT_724067 [Cadophora sp. MPI-SDFR-AT-0126]|nr:hypothetical protein BKA64DRAFT_724067 [Leotiomycetes sp. MPI-SDFR-AT-0126]